MFRSLFYYLFQKGLTTVDPFLLITIFVVYYFSCMFAEIKTMITFITIVCIAAALLGIAHTVINFIQEMDHFNESDESNYE